MKNYKPKICKRCGKEFKPTGGHQVYCEECKDVARKENKKQYYQTPSGKESNRKGCKKYSQSEKGKASHKRYKQTLKGKEANRKGCKKYNKTLKGKVTKKEYNKQYNLTHKEEKSDYNKQYNQSTAGKEAIRKQDAKRRRLDFNPLNDYFEGSEAHHINTKDVIYIPEEMHRSVWHCLETRQGMAEMNTLAIRFLLKQRR